MDNTNTTEWRRWYAWRPVQTISGRWAWLSPVERRWNLYLNPWGYGGYCGTDGGWEYRKPLIAGGSQ